jgi:hypothetical protein
MMRLVIVLTVLAVFLAAGPLLAAARRRDDNAVLPHDSLARFAVAGASRTWVVFTTPYCATCGPVMADLRRAFPDDGVVGVDATDEPELTHRLGVRRSPTVFEIDAQGEILDRMIGPESVRDRLPTVEFS